jgi:hypothetical protein
MRDDFAAFILTHRRPDNQITVKSLAKSGYTGKVYWVVDDGDPTLDEYRAQFGDDSVLVFNKEAIAREFDQGDNFTSRGSVFFARNAVWSLARSVGVRYFVQLDDDYRLFQFRTPGAQRAVPGMHGWTMRRSLDRVFDAMVEFLSASGAATVAMAQGGDFIGGADKLTARLTRKAMNSFVCDVEHPFMFMGRINEDVNSYVSLGNRGELFFTYWSVQLDQEQTQQSAGGMTDLYLDSGTYIKSFYTVMYAPSCVRVVYSPAMRRYHHSIAWEHAVPKIIHERYRQGGHEAAPTPTLQRISEVA